MSFENGRQTDIQAIPAHMARGRLSSDIAAGLFGAKYAVILRISANIFSSAYTFICDKILSRMLARF